MSTITNVAHFAHSINPFYLVAGIGLVVALVLLISALREALR